MRVGKDLTRYFAIWGRNLGENWQEGFHEIQKANCSEKESENKDEGGRGRVRTAAHGGRRETG